MSEKSSKKRVYFTVQAPEANSVRVLGSFNDWSERDLKPATKGIWRTWFSLPPGRYEYRFQVDGEWANDPEAPKTQNPFGTENSVQVVE